MVDVQDKTNIFGTHDPATLRIPLSRSKWTQVPPEDRGEKHAQEKMLGEFKVGNAMWLGKHHHKWGFI